MPKVNVGPRIDESAAKWYEEMFETRNAGASFVLNTFPLMYRDTLRYELTGVFTRGELCMMLDVNNGGSDFLITFGPQYTVVKSLYLEISDSFDLYPGSYEDKWGTDKFPFLEKIAKLTLFQEICLKIWIAQFWDLVGEEAPYTDEYVSQLLKPDQEGYVPPKAPPGRLPAD